MKNRFLKSVLVLSTVLALVNCSEETADAINNLDPQANQPTEDNPNTLPADEPCWLLNAGSDFLIYSAGIVTDVNGNVVGTITFIDGTLTGANNCDGCGGNQIGGLIVEIVLTFIFVLVVLGTTDAKKGAGNFAGLAIGLSLILIHLVGIHYTGTSVNPARSIGPALFQGGVALTEDLWVFIVGPFIGAALSAFVWKAIGEE